MHAARSTIHLISKNAWSILIEELSVRDLLELRRTCKRMNEIVKSFNERWYRAHQWYVNRVVSHAKVKSVAKIHQSSLTALCISRAHPRLNGLSWNQKSLLINSGVQDGTFTKADCRIRYHWKYKVPAREQDVPLDYNYKPKRNKYIYWYMIECYRQMKTKTLDKISFRRAEVDKHKNQRTILKKTNQEKLIEIERNKRRIVESYDLEDQARVELLEAIRGHEVNKIFEGVRINCYKSVGDQPKAK